MIRFECKNCGKRIKTPDSSAGKKGWCPHCKNAVVVPALEAAPAAAPEKKQPAFDLSDNFWDIPETKNETQTEDSPSEGDDEQYYNAMGGRDHLLAPEPIPERKLPWLLDIFAFPLNMNGLIIIGIVTIIPFSIDLLAKLLGIFGFIVSIPGFFVKIVVGAYSYWYICECIRASADGEIRAPETVSQTPGLWELFCQCFWLNACTLLYLCPAILYWLYFRRVDAVLFAILAVEILIFPMALLSVILHNSYTGFNPFIVIWSVMKTFIPYIATLFLCLGVTFLAYLIVAILLLPFGITVATAFDNPDNTTTAAIGTAALFAMQLLFGLFGSYISMIQAHLLGRFYWRNEKTLDWCV